MSQVIGQQSQVGHFLVDILVVELHDADQNFTRDEKDSAAGYCDIIVTDKVLGELALLESVLITSNMHALDNKFVWLLPAA